MSPLIKKKGHVMSKVLKQNVILGGQEYKAGSSESDIPIEVKKLAAPFLIDEKKYKPPGKPGEAVDVKIQPHISALESEVTSEKDRADKAESDLSEANSSIAGLKSQLEEEKSRPDAAEIMEKLSAAEEALATSEEKITELEMAVKQVNTEADEKLDDAIQKLNDAEEALATVEDKVAELETAAKEKKTGK